MIPIIKVGTYLTTKQKVRFFYARLKSKKGHTLTIGWALVKGDWWREDGEPRKFITFGSVVHDGMRRTGIYIARLGIAHMQKVEG